VAVGSVVVTGHCRMRKQEQVNYEGCSEDGDRIAHCASRFGQRLARRHNGHSVADCGSMEGSGEGLSA
jgi:hypothetical protein